MTILDDLRVIPKTADFVVFDLETTGFSRKNDRIVEIGALKYRGGEVVESFHVRVNPEMDIPAKVSEIHGIFDKDVKDSDIIDVVLPTFMAFIGKGVLVAHNANFDIGFLKANLERLKMSIPFHPVLDTMGIIKKTTPGLSSYSQVNLAAHFGIEVKAAHTAEDDCRVCLELLKIGFEAMGFEVEK